MAILAGILQVIVFLFLLKLAHIVYWNVRKTYHVHPWLLESVIAIVLVVIFNFVSSVWGLMIVSAVAIGMIRGDQESKSEAQRSRQLQ